MTRSSSVTIHMPDTGRDEPGTVPAPEEPGDMAESALLWGLTLGEAALLSWVLEC